MPRGASFERFERACLVDVNDVVELVRKPCVEVVAMTFAAWKVKNANGPLQIRARQRVRQRRISRDRQKKLPHSAIVKEPFVAAWQRRPNVFALRWSVPFRGRRYRPGMGREADVHLCRTEMLTDELADIQFA